MLRRQVELLFSSLHVLSQRLSALPCRVGQRRPHCTAHLVVLQGAAQAVQYLQHSLQVAVRFPVFVANVRELLPELPVEEFEALSLLRWTGKSVDLFKRVSIRFRKRHCSQQSQSGKGGTVGSTPLRPGSTMPATPGLPLTQSSYLKS